MPDLKLVNSVAVSLYLGWLTGTSRNEMLLIYCNTLHMMICIVKLATRSTSVREKPVTRASNKLFM